jgi:hypothetical protein
MYEPIASLRTQFRYAFIEEVVLNQYREEFYKVPGSTRYPIDIIRPSLGYMIFQGTQWISSGPLRFSGRDKQRLESLWCKFWTRCLVAWASTNMAGGARLKSCN